MKASPVKLFVYKAFLGTLKWKGGDRQKRAFGFPCAWNLVLSLNVPKKVCESGICFCYEAKDGLQRTEDGLLRGK